jgi:hypothetical protein
MSVREIDMSVRKIDMSVRKIDMSTRVSGIPGISSEDSGFRMGTSHDFFPRKGDAS